MESNITTVMQHVTKQTKQIAIYQHVWCYACYFQCTIQSGLRTL